VLRDPLLPLPARISERIDETADTVTFHFELLDEGERKAFRYLPASSARSRPLARVNPPLSLPAIRPGPSG